MGRVWIRTLFFEIYPGFGCWAGFEQLLLTHTVTGSLCQPICRWNGVELDRKCNYLTSYTITYDRINMSMRLYFWLKQYLPIDFSMRWDWICMSRICNCMNMSLLLTHTVPGPPCQRICRWGGAGWGWWEAPLVPPAASSRTCGRTCGRPRAGTCIGLGWVSWVRIILDYTPYMPIPF